MIELPKLPEPDYVFHGIGYSGSDMQAYALAERAAERERCANLAEMEAGFRSCGCNDPDSGYILESLAESIRGQE